MSENFTKKLWIIGYDLRSENSKRLTQAQKDWLASKRIGIWYALRYTFRCAPIQNSLWLIRDEKVKEKLEGKIKEWKNQYIGEGYGNVLLEIFPLQTTDAGFKTFKEWQLNFLIEWITDIEKTIDGYIKNKSITVRTLDAIKKKLELIESIFNEDFSKTEWGAKFDEVNDMIMINWDKVGEVEGYAK